MLLCGIEDRYMLVDLWLSGLHVRLVLLLCHWNWVVTSYVLLRCLVPISLSFVEHLIPDLALTIAPFHNSGASCAIARTWTSLSLILTLLIWFVYCLLVDFDSMRHPSHLVATIVWRVPPRFPTSTSTVPTIVTFLAVKLTSLCLCHKLLDVFMTLKSETLFHGL